jgi:hypothetical protein
MNTKKISISIATLLLITAVGTHQGAFALHDSNLDVNTWITQNGTQAQTINLNQGPVSQPPTEGATVAEEEGAAAEEEPSPPEPATEEEEEEDEEDEEDETTTPEEDEDNDNG